MQVFAQAIATKIYQVVLLPEIAISWKFWLLWVPN
jgi:hypothetical protein